MENSIEKEFVSYQEALDMKELGFDEPCFGSHGDGKLIQSIMMSQWKNNEFNIILAPTFSQCFRFFRQKHGLIHQINNLDNDDAIWEFRISSIVLSDDNNVDYDSRINYPFFKSYPEAELECLKNLIEIVKNK